MQMFEKLALLLIILVLLDFSLTGGVYLCAIYNWATHGNFAGSPLDYASEKNTLKFGNTQYDVKSPNENSRASSGTDKEQFEPDKKKEPEFDKRGTHLDPDMPVGPSGVPIYQFPQSPYENLDFDELLRNQLHPEQVRAIYKYETSIKPAPYAPQTDNWKIPDTDDIHTDFDREKLRHLAKNNGMPEWIFE